jgi:hypothetical protein
MSQEAMQAMPDNELLHAIMGADMKASIARRLADRERCRETRLSIGVEL